MREVGVRNGTASPLIGMATKLLSPSLNLRMFGIGRGQNRLPRETLRGRSQLDRLRILLASRRPYPAKSPASSWMSALLQPQLPYFIREAPNLPAVQGPDLAVAGSWDNPAAELPGSTSTVTNDLVPRLLEARSLLQRPYTWWENISLDQPSYLNLWYHFDCL